MELVFFHKHCKIRWWVHRMYSQSWECSGCYGIANVDRSRELKKTLWPRPIVWLRVRLVTSLSFMGRVCTCVSRLSSPSCIAADKIYRTNTTFPTICSVSLDFHRKSRLSSQCTEVCLKWWHCWIIRYKQLKRSPTGTLWYVQVPDLLAQIPTSKWLTINESDSRENMQTGTNQWWNDTNMNSDNDRMRCTVLNRFKCTSLFFWVVRSDSGVFDSVVKSCIQN